MYEHKLTDIDSTFSRQCIRFSDITEVKLAAGGIDSWYANHITTVVQFKDGTKKVLSEDKTFNKWLDIDEPNLYPYDATQHKLMIKKET